MKRPTIYIPTKNRQDTIQTHKYFAGHEYYVLVHSKEQYDLYAKYSEQTGLDMRRVVITNVPADDFGLTRQREYVCKTLTAKDEWLVFADDNIKEVQAVDIEHYRASELPVQSEPALRIVYETRCEPERFLTEIFNECVAYAEESGARHVGFSSVDNFFFRGRHWKPVSYIIGKLMLWKNTGELKFDHSITMEDFELTAQSLLKFGVAPVNGFVYPVAGHYQKGGMGRKDERLEARKRDVKLLMEKYPGLFALKAGEYPDLKLRFYNRMQVLDWQKEIGVKSSPKTMWG